MRCLSILTACAGLASAMPALSARQGSSDKGKQQACKERGLDEAECDEYEYRCNLSGWRGNLLPDCLKVIYKACKKDSDCGDRFQCQIAGFLEDEGMCDPKETSEAKADKEKDYEAATQREREEEEKRKEEEKQRKEKEQKKIDGEKKKVEEENKKQDAEALKELGPLRVICDERGITNLELCAYYKKECQTNGRVTDDELRHCLRTSGKVCNDNASICGDGFTCEWRGLDEICEPKPLQKPQQRDEQEAKQQAKQPLTPEILAVCKERGWEEDEACSNQKSICEQAGWGSDQLVTCLKGINKDCKQTSDCGAGFECAETPGAFLTPNLLCVPQAKKQEEAKQKDGEIRAVCKERGWEDDAVCDHQKGICEQAGWVADQLLKCLKDNGKDCEQTSDCGAGLECSDIAVAPRKRKVCLVQPTPAVQEQADKDRAAAEQKFKEEDQKRKEEEQKKEQQKQEDEQRRKEEEQKLKEEAKLRDDARTKELEESKIKKLGTLRDICEERGQVLDVCYGNFQHCEENGRVTDDEFRRCLRAINNNCKQDSECGDGFKCGWPAKPYLFPDTCMPVPLQKPQLEAQQPPKQKCKRHL